MIATLVAAALATVIAIPNSSAPPSSGDSTVQMTSVTLGNVDLPITLDKLL
jgi:hypothetical protein